MFAVSGMTHYLRAYVRFFYLLLFLGIILNEKIIKLNTKNRSEKMLYDISAEYLSL